MPEQVTFSPLLDESELPQIHDLIIIRLKSHIDKQKRPNPFHATLRLLPISCFSETMSQEPFLYSALNDPSKDGRLINLHPSSSEDILVYNLMNIKAAAMPEYEALSYVWGPRSLTREITVKAETKYIRENLWSALYHMQLPLKPLVLWIDAICIDQENMDERNHQVRLVGKIYTGATTILVWLRPVGASSNCGVLLHYRDGEKWD